MKPLVLPCECPVAGVSYRQAAVLGVAVGDQVTVVAVDDNPYDPRAVEVRHGDQLLGFVPATLAARLRVSGAQHWAGQVTRVLDGHAVRGLRIAIAAQPTRNSRRVPTPKQTSPRG